MIFLKTALATVIDGGQTIWDTLLDSCLFAYRPIINTKVNEKPFYFLYGRDVVLPNDLVFDIKNNYFDSSDEKLYYKCDLAFRLKNAYEFLVRKREIQSAKYKAFYDKFHKKIEFKVNDLVSVYWQTPLKGLSKKFLAIWRGPFEVVKRSGNVTYRVEKGTVSIPCHVQRLKPYDPYSLS